MKIREPEKRLQQFWGEVDKKHIQSIIPFIHGKKVLDIGCGNGSTTNYLNNNLDIECIGIDNEENEVAKAKKLFPKNNYLHVNAEKLPFNRGSFDTIILRDAMHHLYEESDFEKVRLELLRVTHPGSVFIVLDPNINHLLKFLRKLSAHKDFECSFENAIYLFKLMNLEIIHHDFHTIFTLPLSGGYVGIDWVPKITIIWKALLDSEKLIEKLIHKTWLARHICWRYLLVGIKNKSDE